MSRIDHSTTASDEMYIWSQLKNGSLLSIGTSKTLHAKIVVIRGFDWVGSGVGFRIDHREE